MIHATPLNASANQRVYLRCRVEPGQFNSEYIAYLTAAHPSNPSELIETQMFVDAEDVIVMSGQPRREHPVEALVRVSFVENPDDQHATVVLPQETTKLNPRVSVPSDQIVCR